jgi:hypothetical protein
MAEYSLTSPISVKSGSGVSTINLYPAASPSFAVQIQTPTTLTENVQFILPSFNGTPGQYLQWGGGSGGASGWNNGSSNVNSTLPLGFRFNDSSGAPASITSNTFTALGTFYYGGTITDNSISYARAVVRTTNVVATGQLQLFNLTTNQIISTSPVFGPTNGSIISVNLNTIANVPSTPSIMEIRLRRVNTFGGGNAGLYSFQIYG